MPKTSKWQSVTLKDKGDVIKEIPDEALQKEFDEFRFKILKLEGSKRSLKEDIVRLKKEEVISKQALDSIKERYRIRHDEFLELERTYQSLFVKYVDEYTKSERWVGEITELKKSISPLKKQIKAVTQHKEMLKQQEINKQELIKDARTSGYGKDFIRQLRKLLDVKT